MVTKAVGVAARAVGRHTWRMRPGCDFCENAARAAVGRATLCPRKSMMSAEEILNVQHLASKPSFVIAVAARLGLAGWARLKQPCSRFGGRSHLVRPRPSPAHTCRMCECCALTRWDQHRHVARGQPRPSGHLIRRRWVARSVPPRGTVTEPSSIGRGMGPRRRSSPRGVVAAHG
jgi:hypothetical protein